MTRSARTFDKSAMISSVRPSLKYSLSGSGLKLANGRTTMERRFDAAASAAPAPAATDTADGGSVPELDWRRSAASSSRISLALCVRRFRSFSRHRLISQSSSRGRSFPASGTAGGGAPENGPKESSRARPLEGTAPRRHLVEHDAEREDVGPVVESES